MHHICLAWLTNRFADDSIFRTIFFVSWSNSVFNWDIFFFETVDLIERSISSYKQDKHLALVFHIFATPAAFYFVNYDILLRFKNALSLAACIRALDKCRIGRRVKSCFSHRTNSSASW